MYIHSAKIKNIRSIKDLKMEFDPDAPQGWHVVIGDNGAGKSSLAKSLAIGLLDHEEVVGLRENWAKWLRQGCRGGSVETDMYARNKPFKKRFILKREEENVFLKRYRRPRNLADGIYSHPGLFSTIAFSASYGPFRRFGTESREYEKLRESHPGLNAHLSLFGENGDLSESLEWLQDLRFKQLEGKEEGEILEPLINLLNEGDLLPDGIELKEVSSEGVTLRDAGGNLLNVKDLSDGYRSVLSLSFDLIRQMVRFFGHKKVFKRILKGEMVIDLPGVVIIDEIDVHLHPSWQKRIGYWFTRYFPKIQFIVTTHSPIVCHAAEKGSVWRIASPDSDQESGRVTGTELDRLLYGNVVEALDTELFGKNVSRSASSVKKLERMAKLNFRSMLGKITEEEKAELQKLRSIMPTGGGPSAWGEE